MHVTDRTDYALRVLLYLAAHDARASVSTVAAAYDISEAHLAKVAQALAREGFIETSPGRTGGMVLARDAAEITLGSVVRALEPTALVECMGAENTCPAVGPCGLAGALAAARDAFLASLDGVTLAQAARQKRALRGRLDPAARIVPLRRDRGAQQRRGP
ncbi:MAG: Rrf2 family transcriptional regulator [Polyangiales bacterium]